MLGPSTRPDVIERQSSELRHRGLGYKTRATAKWVWEASESGQDGDVRIDVLGGWSVVVITEIEDAVIRLKMQVG